jgi:poly(hydroxyalkanoate) granule-associated protein
MATRKSRNNRTRPRKRPDRDTATASASRNRGRTEHATHDAPSRQAQLLQGVQQVWLAGMGAVARAQQDGPGAFNDAVAEGLKLLDQSRSTAQRMVRDAFETAQETLQSRVGGARGQAQETWDNLEALFQNRVQRAMHQLGVPTAEEIRALTRRVTELNENVRQINARERGRKAPGSKQRRVPGPRRRKAATPSSSSTE